MPATRVRFTAQFGRTLDAALDFLVENDAQAAAARLRESVLLRLPELLRLHPRMGRDFMLRVPRSIEAEATYAQVATLLGTTTELREYILGDYLVLYAIEGSIVYLIAIRHHRQSAWLLHERGR